MSREPLPIDAYLPAIVDKLSLCRALVLAAEPGAGKTTRVPPAILDAGLAELAGGRPGKIVVLQPRRVAARAAAARVASERGGDIGIEVGYQVRFERRLSHLTRILFCTDGVFLRKLNDDPFIEDIAAVVFDEFHERRLDSDLALAMVRKIRDEVRADLRVIVMSATLDTGPVARYLGGCPEMSCPGRAYPIEITYQAPPASQPLEESVAAAVKCMLARTDGHVLVFLPGIAEIRQAQSLLAAQRATADLAVAPLYGDMPLAEQQSVLRPSRHQKIVLATNVAETSITIDGVGAVVDSGLARINRLDPRLGMNRLQVCRISRASADQRAGRAGRTGSGFCLRLWSEREQQSLRDYELPEIARVELSQVVLQLIAWGEKDVRAFPWFESPPPAALDQALLLLERLDGLSSGRLTALGKRMAALPVQPRTARLLIEGERLGHGSRAALCAALIEERDPLRRPESRGPAAHASHSDVLDRLEALESYAGSGSRLSPAGELLAGAARQILQAGEQLERLMEESHAGGQHPGASTADQAICRAILSAFPDRVCRPREPGGRRAIMVGGRGVRLADESALGFCELFVAVELLDTGRQESLVRQASAIEKGWLAPEHISASVLAHYDPALQKVTAARVTRFFDLVIDEQVVPLPADLDAAALLAEAAAASFNLADLASDSAKQFIARIQCLRQWMPELDLPDFGPSPWQSLLADWCAGCTSIEDMRGAPFASIIRAKLTEQQAQAVDRQAPESMPVPSGRRISLVYEQGKPPVLAARIQEMFGLADTPRIAAGRVPVLLHLLAPNHRVQQITDDLASFWKNTYPEVKKELKRRYPKHAWPDDPLKAQPQSRPARRP